MTTSARQDATDSGRPAVAPAGASVLQVRGITKHFPAGRGGAPTAHATCPRQAGAEVYRHTWVSDLRARSDGTWDVVTDEGEIHAEHVVNAAGCGSVSPAKHTQDSGIRRMRSPSSAASASTRSRSSTARSRRSET